MSQVPPPVSHPAVRIARAVALTVGIVAVAGTVALVVVERRWDARNVPQTTPAGAFVNGPIGTELTPLVVFEVLPDLFPDEFAPLDAYLKAHNRFVAPAGDWVDQFGFIRKNLAPEPRDGTELPVGFVLSYRRPGSGAGSPVPFVALSCAACHSAEIRVDPDRPGVVLYGVGNPTMNLLAFSEAVRGLVLKRTDPGDPESGYVLTVGAVADAQAKRGRVLTTAERAIVALWIPAARGEAGDYRQVIDDPYPAHQLFDPRFMLAGPNRTQPFRSLVRIHLGRPGWSAGGHEMDQGFSKVPAVYHQDEQFHGKWAQFDGTAGNVVVRSTLAASTAGANVHNLSRPDTAAHIKAAAEYTRALAPPAWDAVFPDHKRTDAQQKQADAGKIVYREHCRRCHGEPDGAGWTWDRNAADNRFGEVEPQSRIGTDPERVRFRHGADIPRVVSAKFTRDFRKDHPLATYPGKNGEPIDAFAAADLRTTDGYYNGPVGGAFLRAPYLHNASVLTLAELVGKEPRRAKFYRGRNAYDVANVGLYSPPVPEGVDRKNPRPHDRNYYFLFDTAERGNSNRGHEYPPWGNFHGGGKLTDTQKSDLTNLIEYLRTL